MNEQFKQMLNLIEKRQHSFLEFDDRTVKYVCNDKALIKYILTDETFRCLFINLVLSDGTTSYYSFIIEDGTEVDIKLSANEIIITITSIPTQKSIAMPKSYRNALGEILKRVSGVTGGPDLFDADKELFEKGFSFFLNGKIHNIKFRDARDLLNHFDIVTIS